MGGEGAALLLPRGESLRSPTSQLGFRLHVWGRILLGELP